MKRILQWLLVPAAVVAALMVFPADEAQAHWRRVYRYYPAPYAAYYGPAYGPYYAPRVGVYVGPPAVSVEVYRPGIVVPVPVIPPPPPPPPVFWW